MSRALLYLWVILSLSLSLSPPSLSLTLSLTLSLSLSLSLFLSPSLSLSFSPSSLSLTHSLSLSFPLSLSLSLSILIYNQPLHPTRMQQKCSLFNKIKQNFFQAMVVPILLYWCATRTLTKRIEKKVDGNCVRILRIILHNSWKQQHTKKCYTAINLQSLKYPNKTEKVCDVLLRTPSHERANIRQHIRTYL